MKSQYHLRMDSLLLQGLNRGLYIGINEANAIAYGHFTPIVYYHKVWNSYFLLSVVEWWDFSFFLFFFFLDVKQMGYWLSATNLWPQKSWVPKPWRKLKKLNSPVTSLRIILNSKVPPELSDHTRYWFTWISLHFLEKIYSVTKL